MIKINEPNIFSITKVFIVVDSPIIPIYDRNYNIEHVLGNSISFLLYRYFKQLFMSSVLNEKGL